MTFSRMFTATGNGIPRRHRSFRRCMLAALSCALVQLAAPAPAQAWFGWLDHLSGPGPFSGPQFEFRVACFGEESVPHRLRRQIAEARRLLAQVVPGGTERDNLPPVQALEDVVTEIEAAVSSFPVFHATDPSPLVTLRSRVLELDKEARSADLATRAGRPGDRVTKPTTDLVEAALKGVETLLPTAERATATLVSTGVLWSVCGNEKARRTSVEVGVNFWQTRTRNRDYAQGEKIHLTTVMPSVTWRILTNPNYDVLDAGVGGGVYWFSSNGFDGFSGIVLQPGRFDLHAPTRWATYKLDGSEGGVTVLKFLARTSSLLNFRYGFMTFPQGFPAGAFAPRAGTERRFPAEVNQSFSIFLNLKPLGTRLGSSAS